MEPSSQITPTKLLWIDLEMTGLDPNQDVILEVAAEVTGFDLKTIASYEARVKQPRDLVVKLFAANTFYSQTFTANRDEFLDKLDEGKDSKTVEDELIKLVTQHFGNEPAILAGNSIYNDRKFISKYWPELDLKLHYRMLDVSSFKVLMQGKYDVNYEKNDTHRAYEDIQASIAELEYYLDWLTNH